MRLTEKQISELERVAKDYKVDRNLLVWAISHLGIDVVLNCIDASDYDWELNNGSNRSNWSYRERLISLLEDNGFDDASIWR